MVAFLSIPTFIKTNKCYLGLHKLFLQFPSVAFTLLIVMVIHQDHELQMHYYIVICLLLCDSLY